MTPSSTGAHLNAVAACAAPHPSRAAEARHLAWNLLRAGLEDEVSELSEPVGDRRLGEL